MSNVEIDQQSAWSENLGHLNSALAVLGEMPSVEGNELDRLLAKFHESVKTIAGSEVAFAKMCALLKEINPHFILKEFSTLPKANVLANVVAGIYGPLIHGFSQAVIENIQMSNLPEVIVAPPRDTIPLVTSLKTMAGIEGVDLQIIKPPVTRKTAGIPNNQSSGTAKEDPLFRSMVHQEFKHRLNGTGLTEIEFGIYSTTSLKIARLLKSMGLKEKYIALKFYGLGPNLSYVHGLLSGGKEWVAESAESQLLVDPAQIAGLMVLLDSLEEFGMQSVYQSVSRLYLGDDGKILPFVQPVDVETFEIARATNEAIASTALYYATIGPGFAIHLLEQVPHLVELAHQGYPFILQAPIPPMDNKEQHFASIRTAGVFSYPELVLRKEA
ncbi:hypothetical protein ISS42_00220 [Candidatus Shapirobacteria bacterium]|nr:hypothetical protein [Candidatus Shapirobacteria bacterium]